MGPFPGLLGSSLCLFCGVLGVVGLCLETSLWKEPPHSQPIGRRRLARPPLAPPPSPSPALCLSLAASLVTRPEGWVRGGAVLPLRATRSCWCFSEARAAAFDGASPPPPPPAMSREESSSKAVTVRDVQLLMKKKEEIEAQIQAYYEVLEDQKGVGMNEPLVDVEGYPRADVDLYQVRTARHNIICLQNDHKALMREVEEALHQLHAQDKEKHAKDEAEARAEAMSQALPQPFAKVNAVTPGSPASLSGLQVDDEIVEFGSVNTHNFQSLQNIATVVQHSEGKPLSVTVIRGGERLHLGLTPKRWNGRGLLGCNILPLQR